eukprot:8433544-Karenia_brevis.AAC.1
MSFKVSRIHRTKATRNTGRWTLNRSISIEKGLKIGLDATTVWLDMKANTEWVNQRWDLYMESIDRATV